MARTRLIRRLIWFITAIILFLAAGFAALVIWVSGGPRSLASLAPYVESALTSPDGSYHVKIGTPMLLWDGWSHPVAIRIQNVDVLDAKGAALAHFPEVGVRMYFFELFLGRIDIKSVELINPVAKLVEDAQGNIMSFGFSDTKSSAGAPIPAALALLTSESGDNPVTHFQSFIIRHASLTVEDSSGKPFLSSSSASFEIVRKHGAAEGRLTMPLQFGDKRSQIDVRFNLNGPKRTVSSDVVFDEVPSEILRALAPAQKWMDDVHVSLSGRAGMISDFDANIDKIDFSIETGPGIIDLPGQFEQALEPKHMKVVGYLSEKLTRIDVRQGTVDFAGHSLIFHGTAHKVGEDYGVDGYAETGNAPVDEIHEYWPLKLAPHSRHWVTTHLKKGMVSKADVSLHFKPGEFKLKDTPEAAVDATITVKGTTVLYKPSHPPITGIDGIVRFTGKMMDAKITHADYMDETHISEARVRFPDFYPDDVRLFMDMVIETSAKDVRRFLSLPDLNKSSKLGLRPDITGQASGKAKLDFIAFSENEKDDVGATGRLSYSIDANLKDVTQNRFMGNHDIANAFMKLEVNNKGIKVAGKANVNDVPMNIDLASVFGGDNKTTYAIKTDMPIARMSDFGLPQMDFAKGSMGVNATFISTDSEDKADAVLDLTNTAISLPKQGLYKKLGGKALLKISTERLASGNTHISQFTLKGDQIDVAGEAEYDKTAGDFNRFTIKPLKWVPFDLKSLVYEKNANLVQLTAQGHTFDVSPYLKDSVGKNDLDYRMDLRLDRLILGEGRELGDVIVEADCPASACKSALINARLKDGTTFNYKIAGGQLVAACANTGELMRMLGIVDTLDGGVMTLKGQYSGETLNGELEVKDYRLKNAPVVTKIFTIASLTGILNTLTGNGIYFDRLSAPFVYRHGNLILKEAKTHGSALGMTADGSINVSLGTLDITGVLVPSYMLNSLIGNLPLVGNLLMGGSGKGLVALSYGIHGNMKDPSIRVNPLSVLTPGFLRDVFTIFDKPPPDMEAIEAAQKKVAVPKESPANAQAPIPPVAAPLNSLPSVDELKK